METLDIFLDESGQVGIVGDVNCCGAYSDESVSDILLKSSDYGKRIQAIIDEAKQDLIDRKLLIEKEEQKKEALPFVNGQIVDYTIEGKEVYEFKLFSEMFKFLKDKQELKQEVILAINDSVQIFNYKGYGNVFLSHLIDNKFIVNIK